VEDEIIPVANVVVNFIFNQTSAAGPLRKKHYNVSGYVEMDMVAEITSIQAIQLTEEWFTANSMPGQNTQTVNST